MIVCFSKVPEQKWSYDRKCILKVIEKIPLTVEAIQYNLDQIDVNDKSTPAPTIGFRASNIRGTSEPNRYEQGILVSILIL